MALISVKNHVVFKKPFWYYKVMSECADRNISIFTSRIHSIVIYIVAKYSSFNKKKEIIDKDVEK